MQVGVQLVYSAAWMSLTETALGPPPLVLGVSSSTMRGGAVGPSSSCVRHAAKGAGKEEDGRKIYTCGRYSR